MAAGHYHEAVLEYRKSATKENAPSTSISRYALATLYDGTPEEGLEILHLAEVNGKMADQVVTERRRMVA